MVKEKKRKKIPSKFQREQQINIKSGSKVESRRTGAPVSENVDVTHFTEQQRRGQTEKIQRERKVIKEQENLKIREEAKQENVSEKLAQAEEQETQNDELRKQEEFARQGRDEFGNFSGGVSSAEGLITDIATLAAGGIAVRTSLKAGKKVATSIATRFDVDAIGKGLGFTAKQNAALAKELGRQRISLVARDLLTRPGMAKIGQMSINGKNQFLSTQHLKTVFSNKAMIIFGSWASSVFLGRWAQAEAPESIVIPIRDAIGQAELTGNWETVDQYLEAAEELTDPSTWEKIILWSPLSAVAGTTRKIEGVAQGVQLLSEIADETKRLQGGK